MANFDYLKAQIAARIHDNTEQEITAEDVRRSFNDTIDAINAAKEDEGAVAPAAWGGITGTLSAQTDLQTALNGKQAVIADLGTIRSGAAAGATAYQKPSGGIPKTDLNNAVQSSLDKADSAYQKPGTGIPKADLASGVQTSLGKADTAYQKPNNGIPKSDLTYAVQTSLGRADSAVQPGSLAAVATSGSYNDLLNKPTIPAAPGTLNTNNSTAQNVSSSEALSGTVKLHKVSKTGSYNDLTDKPTIPTVHNMAAGGITGQVLAKKSNTDYDTEWVNQSGGGVWGSITGDLDDQTDLKNALDAKQDIISNLATIESGAAAGATAVQPGDLASVATSGQYSDLTGTPSLATVATTGDYDDLLNKPSIPAAQVNSDWNAISGVAQILNKPSLATVATSGLYSDLSGTPTIPSAPGTLNTTATTAQATNASEALSGSVTLHKVAKTGTYSDLIGAPSLATVATSGSYNDLSNKPTIPTVPTISTDIDADAASDTKTASPKAVATYVGNPVESISAPVPNDGTIVFTHRNGDTDTVDLNHVHTQYVEASDLASVATSGAYADLSGKPDLSVYPKYYLCADEAAYQAIANKDAATLYLIPES